MPSRVHRCGLAACLIAAGCLSNQRFEEVAPGVSVTRQSIDDYARKHGLTRDEAKQRITAEVTATDASDPDAKGWNALEVVTGPEFDGRQPQ